MDAGQGNDTGMTGDDAISNRDHIGAGRRFTIKVMLLFPVLMAAASWLCLQAVNPRIYGSDLKILIPLEITVVDDVDGQPISNARVDERFLYGAQGRGEQGQLGGLSPYVSSTPPTDRLGRTKGGMMAIEGTRIEFAMRGLIPTPRREISFPKRAGLIVQADGFETSAKLLEEIRTRDGLSIANGVPCQVVIPLKRSLPRAQ